MREPRLGTPAQRSQRDTVILARLAGRQHGVVSRSQLAALGITGSTVSRWAAAGRLHRILPSVYSVGHTVLSPQGRLWAALLYAGPGSAASHTTAGWVWSLIATEPRRIHVIVPGRRRSVAFVHVHRSRLVDATEHRGLSVTTVARTLVDLGAVLSEAALRRVVAEADYRRILDIRDLEQAMGQGRAGSRVLRQVLELHQPKLARTLSALEERFLRLCEGERIPLPEVNAKLCGLMVDALWHDQRVVVELDGYRAHSTPAAIERDHGRDLTLRSAGYRVLRYTWQQVTEHPHRVASDLRAAL